MARRLRMLWVVCAAEDCATDEHLVDTNADPVCPRCGATEDVSYEAVGCPMPLRASFHDGHKRGGGYQELKEAGKLEAESFNLPPDRRGEYRKQIRKLKETKK